MATTLQTLLTRINSVDDNTSLKDLLLLTKDLELYGATKRVYDSAGTLPLDSAFVGSMLMTQQNTFYTLNDSGGLVWTQVYQAPLADSIGPSFVPIILPWTFGGTISGYTSGGGTAPTTGLNTIDKFSFTSDGNATDVGDLTIARTWTGAGQSSSVSGYTSGGYSTTDTKVIEKFPFATDENAVSVGNLTNFMFAGSSHHTQTYGYHGGGTWSAGATSYSNIDQISFATDGDATTVGNLSTARYPSTGQSSLTDGYSMNPVIRDKFPFASGGTAVDLGNLPTLRSGLPGAGQSSGTDGYYVVMKNDYTTSFIDKYPFASDTFASSIGTMTVLRYYTVGQSSTTHGYTTGGIGPTLNPSNANIVDKFSFVSEGNATDVGDVTVNRFRSSGQQY